MTKPDEALLWAREKLVKFWEQSGASRKDIAMHVAMVRAGDYDRNLHDDVYLRRSWLDGHRAGAAASEARIKALEEALWNALPHLEKCFTHHAWHTERPFEPHYITNIRALLKEGDQ